VREAVAVDADDPAFVHLQVAVEQLEVLERELRE
jgi:hypothetical protein